MSAEPWLHDPELMPLPYRSELECSPETNLALGIFESDGIVTPHPPIVRAIREVKEALEAAGHKVVLLQSILVRPFC